MYQDTEAESKLMKVLLSSVSYAGVSPAQVLDGQLYMSGQVAYENDVMSVINHCEALGYS